MMENVKKKNRKMRARALERQELKPQNNRPDQTMAGWKVERKLIEWVRYCCEAVATRCRRQDESGKHVQWTAHTFSQLNKVWSGWFELNQTCSAKYFLIAKSFRCTIVKDSKAGRRAHALETLFARHCRRWQRGWRRRRRRWGCKFNWYRVTFEVETSVGCEERPNWSSSRWTVA